MKMKAVCEATGLTDRTVRYYIDENLISPLYSENYLGRKTFDFSEADIQQLRDIAVLRKFGFSIAEIKEMIRDPDSILRISKTLQARKQASINEEQALLTALSQLDVSRKYTVSDLAAFLSKPVRETALPAEDSNFFRQVLSFIRKVILFCITWLPVALAVEAIFDYYRSYLYPVINGLTILLLAILVLPTILILAVSKFIRKPRAKRILIAILLIFCLLVSPQIYMGAKFAFQVSETSNYANYRRFDFYSYLDRDSILQDLFPDRPSGTAYYSAYYYCYSESVFGDTCDVYAEWFLDAKAFAAEVSRVNALFERTEEDLQYLSVQVGEFTCLVLYSGSPPFSAATEDCTYYIFAYDETNMRVRHIYSSSELNGADQPYYLSLEW